MGNNNLPDARKINLVLLFKVLLGTTILTIFLLALFRDFDHDELEAVHSAWKMLKGEVIYVDFFQHHHPFFYYLISPVIWIIGENTTTLLVLRVLMFAGFLMMLWSTFRMSDLIFDSKKIAWLSILFLSLMTMFSQKSIEIRPDVPQVLLGLLSILFLYRHLKRTSRFLYYLSAVCMGLSFLFLQKTVFIIAGVGLVQLYWVYNRKLTLLNVLAYWLMFGISICPYFLFLFFTDQFETYLFWNWVLNMHFEGSFSAFNAIIDSFYYNHFIWIFFIVGAIFCLKRGLKDHLFLSIVLLSTVFLVQAPYRQYFMPFLPLMCGIAAYGIFELMKYKQVLIIVVLVFLVPMIFFIRTMIVYHNKPQLDKIEWVLNQTTRSDYIYDGDIHFNLFRRDIDFFWYSTEPGKGGLGTYKKLKPYTYNVYLAIQKYKPKIISNLFIDDISNSTIRNNYYRSEMYPNLYVRFK